MKKSRKLRNAMKRKSLNRNARKNKKHRGGILESYGLPECTELSQFSITDENINAFKRTFQSPMDCFINALQLMNVLNQLSANIMRISTLGMSGFTKEQIEMIFAFTHNNNFEFKETHNSDEWISWINNLLEPGNVVFAGYTNHVFIIGRLLNGTILYIDPQIPIICDLSIPECSKYVLGQHTWYLLFNSHESLTEQQQNTIVSYVNHIQNNKFI